MDTSGSIRKTVINPNKIFRNKTGMTIFKTGRKMKPTEWSIQNVSFCRIWILSLMEINNCIGISMEIFRTTYDYTIRYNRTE